MSPQDNAQKFGTLDDYKEVLKEFDSALCEASAVSQATGGRYVSVTLGYATHVFTRIIAHAKTFIISVPLSRWNKSSVENWDFGSNAGNVRSILEASLFFYYLVDAADDEDTQSAILRLMQVYDFNKRVGLFDSGEMDAETALKFEELCDRLRSNKKFQNLPEKVQKNALKGNKLMFEDKKEIIARLGWASDDYYLLWNLTSQYTHVQSMAFYRMEANGRGTGVMNDFDMSMLGLSLYICAGLIKSMVQTLCAKFPDAKAVRRGIYSKFSPGPASNDINPSLNRAQRRRLKKKR